MKRKLIKIGIICLAATILLVGMIGCNNSGNKAAQSISSSSTTPAEPVKLSILQGGGYIVKEDTQQPVLAEIQKKTNTKLELIVVPQAEYNNKLNIMVATGTLPDIIRTGTNYQTYADNNIFIDLAPYIDKYGQNLKKNLDKKLWDMASYKGKQYAIPFENNSGKYVTAVRVDWLKNLNMTMPKTLDEYKVMLEAFTFKDPDKNGKNDTYGLGSYGSWGKTLSNDFDTIIGAFGIGTDQSYINGTQISPTMTSNQYRQAIAFIKTLWDEKVIDPECFTIKTDQAVQKFTKGVSGSVTAWWSIAPQTISGGDPVKDAVWAPITPEIKGPDGKGGIKANGALANCIVISTKCKNPEAAVKLLDYLSTDEGWTLSLKGIQGTHWTTFGAPTAEGQQAFKDAWLDILGHMSSRNDLNNKWNNTTNDAVIVDQNRFILAAQNNSLYDDVFYGLPATDAKNIADSAIKEYETNSFIQFVIGSLPLNDATWTNYVKTWKSKGGQQMQESMVAEYNLYKNTKYTAGY